jgi:light-regulated signal transduction histidine kinase (bacteriophytochrome)
VNCLKLDENAALLSGNYQIAYEKRKKIEDLEEKLWYEESELFLENKQQEFDLRRSDLENQMLQADIERKARAQTTLSIIVGLLSLILLGSYLLWRQNKSFSIKLQEKVKDQTQSLKVMNEQLIDNNRELKRFSHIASHDIKEPIRNIGSFIKLIRRKITPEQEKSLQAYFNIIDKSTNQIYTLVEDIMQYTKIGNKENIPTEAVDLDEMVDSIRSNLSTFIASKNAVVLKQNLQSIQSNNSLLFIILKNLMENGIKYNEEEQPEIEISYLKTDYGHEISVRDNGIGIVSEYRKGIFDMFTRLHTRNEYDGTGLGLSIVQSCVHRLGGVIQLKSEVNVGSKFTVILPIKTAIDKPEQKIISITRAI